LAQIQHHEKRAPVADENRFAITRVDVAARPGHDDAPLVLQLLRVL